jgi:hypothetical protein
VFVVVGEHDGVEFPVPETVRVGVVPEIGLPYWSFRVIEMVEVATPLEVILEVALMVEVVALAPATPTVMVLEVAESVE